MVIGKSLNTSVADLESSTILLHAMLLKTASGTEELISPCPDTVPDPPQNCSSSMESSEVDLLTPSTSQSSLDQMLDSPGSSASSGYSPPLPSATDELLPRLSSSGPREVRRGRPRGIHIDLDESWSEELSQVWADPAQTSDIDGSSERLHLRDPPILNNSSVRRWAQVFDLSSSESELESKDAPVSGDEDVRWEEPAVSERRSPSRVNSNSENTVAVRIPLFKRLKNFLVRMFRKPNLKDESGSKGKAKESDNLPKRLNSALSNNSAADRLTRAVTPWSEPAAESVTSLEDEGTKTLAPASCASHNSATSIFEPMADPGLVDTASLPPVQSRPATPVLTATPLQILVQEIEGPADYDGYHCDSDNFDCTSTPLSTIGQVPSALQTPSRPARASRPMSVATASTDISELECIAVATPAPVAFSKGELVPAEKSVLAAFSQRARETHNRIGSLPSAEAVMGNMGIEETLDASTSMPKTTPIMPGIEQKNDSSSLKLISSPDENGDDELP